MSDFIEFVGKTTEEALQKATAHFDLPLNRLEVEVVSAGSSGLFGILGAKKAKVRVRPLAGSGMEAEMAELAAVVSDNHRPRAPRPAPEPVLQAQPEQPCEARVVAPVEAPAPPAPPAASSPVTPPQPAQPAPEPREPVQPLAVEQPPAPEAEEPALELADEEEEPPDKRLEQDQQVVDHARQALERLVAPLDGSASVTAQSGPHGIELSVQSQDVGVLIGRRGQNLEALQYIVTRIVSHRCGRPVRVVVDAGEYRRRRREALEDMARRMAAKARQTGKPVALGPLPAQERRVIHLTLKGEEGLTTSSRGRGELKKVVISPRG